MQSWFDSQSWLILQVLTVPLVCTPVEPLPPDDPLSLGWVVATAGLDVSALVSTPPGAWARCGWHRRQLNSRSANPREISVLRLGSARGWDRPGGAAMAA